MTSKSKGQRCPRCGSRDVLWQDTGERHIGLYVCLDCDHEFQKGANENRRRDEQRHRKDSRREHR